MSRNQSTDKAYLKHFLQNCLSFFTKEVPEDQEKFIQEFMLATDDWHTAIKPEIYSYSIPTSVAAELIELFDRADTYFLHVRGQSANQTEYAKAIQAYKNDWERLQCLSTDILEKCGYFRN